MTPAYSDTTVLVPVFNEAATIADVLAAVRQALGEEVDILVVDDGSSDDSALRAEACGARVLRLPTNQGKGAALRAGFLAARGELVVTLDADGQDDPSELPRLVEAARNGGDLVIGSRFIGNIHQGAISSINALATRFFNRLINSLYNADITDSQAGVRCFRRTLLRQISPRATEYEIETEMLVLALLLGANVVEVPVSRFPRQSGSTSFSRIRHGLRILSTVLVNRMRRRAP